MSNKKYQIPRLAKAPVPKIKVAVSMPILGDTHAQFTYSYGKLMLYSGASLVADGVIDLLPNMIEGTYLHVARKDLTERALEIGATHILWLDGDMKFPQDALQRLLRHRKAIVGANYVTRRFPVHHVAFKHVDVSDERKHVHCRTTAESTGLEKVAAIGFGLLLMETRIFDSIPTPWFEIEDRPVGEDVAFCTKASEAGFETYVDHDLSKEVQHWGSFPFDYSHAEAWVEGGGEAVA